MSNQNELIIIEREIKKAEELIKVNNFENTLQIFVTVYGLGVTYLYKTYLGRLDNPVELLNFLSKRSIQIYKCTFGKYIELINHTNFIEEVFDIINPGKKYKKSALIENLSEINALRNKVVHPESNSTATKVVDKQFVKVHLELLKLFLNDFKLFSKNEFKVVTKYETFNFQKIVGESQLYESLNEVLNNEDVDVLDVTYLSPKIPDNKRNHTVGAYWSRVNELIRNEKLTLRRVVSFDESDSKQLKLLWFLFNQIPSYYSHLNKRVFFSAFKTSSSLSKELNKSPVNLINLILMYNSSNPDTGHAWLFGSHPKVHSSNQEYLHLYGTNISVLRKVYNDFFNSGNLVTEETIKDILLKRQSNLTADNIDEYINKISKLFSHVGVSEDGIPAIKETYRDILSDTFDQFDEFEW